jgi:hypothetical protein
VKAAGDVSGRDEVENARVLGEVGGADSFAKVGVDIDSRGQTGRGSRLFLTFLALAGDRLRLDHRPSFLFMLEAAATELGQ